MAAEQGVLEGVHRTTSDGWQVLGGGTAGLFSEGQASVNLVAAVPSLHAGFTALVVLFLWRRVRPALRPLLALYPLAMGLALIATGEHYFFDVLLGWLYAGAVMGAWAWWERRRAVATVPADSRTAGTRGSPLPGTSRA
jgi:membrane-associated phospholipid phosphatase